eukprot:1223906-Amphidinium_carterae.2
MNSHMLSTPPSHETQTWSPTLSLPLPAAASLLAHEQPQSLHRIKKTPRLLRLLTGKGLSSATTTAQNCSSEQHCRSGAQCL